MLNLGDTQWLPARCVGAYDIPAFSPVSIIGTSSPIFQAPSGRSWPDRAPPTSFDAMLSVSRPTSYNDRALGVTGPLPMKVGQTGHVAVDGVVRVDGRYLPGMHERTFGTIKDSFGLQLGHGLIVLSHLSVNKTTLCKFGYGKGIYFFSYGSSSGIGGIWDGVFLNPTGTGSIGSGGSGATSAGRFLVGFSATCWAAAAGGVIQLEVFASGPGVYTGISASATSHWQKTTGSPVTYSNQHRVNIAASGIFGTDVAGGFGVRNVSGFTIEHSNYSIWHKSF